ncbi:MAG: arylsulfatase [Acidimicrobiia bacterium]|nr:arylsulfatase [Acidimicrobiia bacterium]
MKRREFLLKSAAACAAAAAGGLPELTAAAKPNVVIIYADDAGYGDVGCYGATKIATPNIDRLAAQGRRFTNAHAPAATCTPSRYALLTGEYAWRKPGTNVLPGDARLIVDPSRTTLPAMMKAAGYVTSVVGKWHLGLGHGDLDWNGHIAPGPAEVGFDDSFIIPATGDRVPCVYVENGRVVNLDPADPISVSYTTPVGTEPTGRDHPELLRMGLTAGHDKTIVNGISRIGYMSGGVKARWSDEDMADTITRRAITFIEQHRSRPFFLYFATHDIHVPRVPHPRFTGRSGLGPRGDAILELDWSVGEITRSLDRLGLAGITVVIFTSDNGPVLDDGYADEAVERLNGHTPAGPLRGGKYSAFEAGTRVPFVVRWPGEVRRGTSDALVSQMDFLASLASLTGQTLTPEARRDSVDVWPALIGRTNTGRDHLVEQAGALSIIVGAWKYIEPRAGARIDAGTNIELGNDPGGQLYNLASDLGEKRNVIAQFPDIAKRLAAKLTASRAGAPDPSLFRAKEDRH